MPFDACHAKPHCKRSTTQEIACAAKQGTLSVLEFLLPFSDNSTHPNNNEDSGRRITTMRLQRLSGIDNHIRITTFFQHAGMAAILIFMPVIAKDVTETVFEIGIIVASFSLAQIISEVYFGRLSDRRGKRIIFIRMGCISCAIVFALHYFADDALLLLAARVTGGVTTGMMIPAMLAYSYEAGRQKRRVASVVSFHALGWLAGIAAVGIVNDTELIFLVSAGLFAAGLVTSAKLPDTSPQKATAPGTTKRVISTNRFLFLALLLRHVGAVSVWTILPLVLTEQMGAELWHVSVVYVANTMTAFVIMNVMAVRINISNVTKFKAGIGMTAFVFVGLVLIEQWWQAMPFMALVGFTWAFLYIGGSFHLMENNPKSTSTGVFSSTISIASVIGPIAAGTIALAYGYEAVMYFAVLIIIAAFAVATRISNADTGNSCQLDEINIKGEDDNRPSAGKNHTLSNIKSLNADAKKKI